MQPNPSHVTYRHGHEGIRINMHLTHVTSPHHIMEVLGKIIFPIIKRLGVLFMSLE